MFVEKPGVAIARLMNCRVTFFLRKEREKKKAILSSLRGGIVRTCVAVCVGPGGRILMLG